MSVPDEGAPRPPLRFDVFGRIIEVRRARGEWQVSYPGSEGKARIAHDIRIPSFVEEPDLSEYLFDFCHEWATPRHPRIRLLTDGADPAL